MALSDRAQDRNLGWRVVKITEVNMTTKHIQAEDQYGTPIMIDVTTQPTLLQIPIVGEHWVATRRGSDWLLEGRYESPDSSLPMDQMNPGDARIEAPGTLWIAGNVRVNGNLVVDGSFPTTPFVYRSPQIQQKEIQTGTSRSFQGAIRPFVGANPPGSPKNGDEWIYDGINGIYWKFVYDNSETTYKWKFIGGPDYNIWSDIDRGTAGNTWFDDPILNVPRDGDYSISFNATVYTSPSASTQNVAWHMSIGDGTTAWYSSYFQFTQSTLAADTWYYQHSFGPRTKTAITSGTSLKLLGVPTNWDFSSSHRGISIVPTRVI